MDRDALFPAIDGWQRTCFRLEALDEYSADYEKHLLAAYSRGEPVRPFDEGLTEWLDHLREERAKGKKRVRVHAIGRQLLTSYLAYEIEWPYVACTEAGEDIRILHRSSWAETPFGERPRDFYLLDDRTVVLMDYDPTGRWIGGDLITDPGQVADFRVLRDRALAEAVPVFEYLDAIASSAHQPHRLALRTSA